MKNILFFILLLLASIIQAQTYNLTFSFDEDATASDSLQLLPGNYLSGFFVSDTLDIDTFYIQVHFENDTTTAGVPVWSNVWYEDERYVIVGSTTLPLYISVRPLTVYAIDDGADPRALWMRLVITATDATALGSAFNIRALQREY